MARNDSAPDEPRNAAQAGGGSGDDEFTPRASSRRTGTPVAADDDFDSRLLDLDVEEESPFLRAQRRVPVRRGPLQRRTAQRLRQGLFWGGSVGLLLLVGVVLYTYGARSWRFQLSSADNISSPALKH